MVSSKQILGVISANPVGDLDKINGVLQPEKYRQILIHHAIPSKWTKLKRTANVIKTCLQYKEQQEDDMAPQSFYHAVCLRLCEQTEGFRKLVVSSQVFRIIFRVRCLKTVCKYMFTYPDLVHLNNHF